MKKDSEEKHPSKELQHPGIIHFYVAFVIHAINLGITQLIAELMK